MKKKMTMMSNLPRDLWEEVLCRIPMTNLSKVRSTCRKWNTLSKNSFFAKKHLAQVAQEAKEEFMVVVMMDYSLYLMGVNLSDKDVESCSIKRQSKLICPGSDQIEVSTVFHCDGLLLCVSKDYTRLVVWNPYCGKPLWIELTHKLKRSRLYSPYALGYDKSSNSHKILRCRDFTIYDLNSDSWRVLDSVKVNSCLQDKKLPSQISQIVLLSQINYEYIVVQDLMIPLDKHDYVTKTLRKLSKP